MNNPAPNDTELLKRLQLNDTGAYRILFDTYWEELFLFAWKRLKSKQDAEDVVQHVFMKLWEHRVTKNIHFSLQAYLYKAVFYEVIGSLKGILGRTEDIDMVNEQVLPVFNDILDKLTVDELNTMIDAEIKRLPDRMQQVYRLSREEDLSIKEIAEKLQISEQTVKNQLTQALARLRKPITQSLLLILLKEVTIP